MQLGCFPQVQCSMHTKQMNIQAVITAIGHKRGRGGGGKRGSGLLCSMP